MIRDDVSFEAHIIGRVAACGTKYIMLEAHDLLGREQLIVPQMCSSNYCPACRIKLLLKIRKALFRSLKGKSWRLVTLTFTPQHLDKVTLLKAVATSFRRLSIRLRKKFPGVQYVRTLEIHKSGNPHLHMIIDRYVPIAWLQLNWNKCGGGIADIRRPHRKDGQKKPCTYKQAARYLTEEIEKAVQDPHRLGVDLWKARIRTITVSKTLSLKPEKSRWHFVERGMTPDAVQVAYESQVWRAKWDGTPIPNYVLLPGDCARIGVGLKSPQPKLEKTITFKLVPNQPTKLLA